MAQSQINNKIPEYGFENSNILWNITGLSRGNQRQKCWKSNVWNICFALLCLGRVYMLLEARLKSVENLGPRTFFDKSTNLPYLLVFLPHLHVVFILLEFIAPVSINFLVVGLVTWSLAAICNKICGFSNQFLSTYFHLHLQTTPSF